MRATGIRHGEAGSNLNLEEGVVGSDLPLTKTGIEQMKERARKLRLRKLGRRALPLPRILYHSPYRRTTESAEVVVSKCPEIEELVPDIRLQEIQKGSWHGQPLPKVMHWEGEIPENDKPFFRPPRGENWEDVASRGVAFILEKKPKDDGEDTEVMYLSHNHVILSATGKMLGLPVQTWEDGPLKNGGLITVRSTLDGWVEDRHEAT